MDSLAEYVINFLQIFHQHPYITYIVFFILAYLDSIAFLGLFIPGTAIVFSTGIFVATSTLEIFISILFLIAGAFFSDVSSFFLGKFFNQKISPFLKRYPYVLDKGQKFFMKFGGISILMGRFIGPLRPVIPFVCGTFGLSSIRFFIIDFISSIISITALFGLGFLVGRSIIEVKKVDPWVILFILIALIIIFVVFKLVWKGLLKLESLGTVLYKKLENMWLFVNPIDKSKISFLCEKKTENPFILTTIFILILTPSFFPLILTYTHSINTNFYFLLSFLGEHLKWIWILFNFLTQKYTLIVLSISPIVLFYVFNCKRLSLYWGFCLLITLFLCILFYKILKITSLEYLINSAIFMFTFNALSFFFFFKKNFRIDFYIIIFILGFIISISCIFFLKEIKINEIFIGDFLGLISFTIISLIAIQNVNQEIFHINIILFNMLLIIITGIPFYWKTLTNISKKNLHTKNLSYITQHLIQKEHILSFTIHKEINNFKKMLHNHGWHIYRPFNILLKPISRKKLILFFKEIKTFPISYWYSMKPILSFTKEDNNCDFILRLWDLNLHKNTKNQTHEYFCIIWSSCNNKKLMKKEILKLKGDGSCEKF